MVIGGSVAGLLTARVLSDRFDRITVVERDPAPESPQPRKGVPQGRHVHVLLGGGARVIERLFPGFFEQLVEAGSQECDFARDLCWFHQGVWKLRTDGQLASYWQSRPFLEHHIRRRTRGLTNLQIIEQASVTRLLASPDKARVVGVELQGSGDEGPRQLQADLVVDAGGRGSRAAKWLASLGYEPPRETRVEINIGYASRLYEPPDEPRPDWSSMAIYATPPRTRSGYIFPIEGQRWIATAAGFLEDYPPEDEEGFLEFFRSLEQPHLYHWLKQARPLTPVTSFRFPAHRRRHYERLSRFPAGLLVVGDALACFNPVYGQGMSVSALQVDLLDRLLQKIRGPALPEQFAQRFFGKVSRVIDTPWLLATNSDFLYPQTAGRRPWGSGLLNWYVVNVFGLCEWNRGVLLRFYRVMNFLDSPLALFHPYVVYQVLRRSLGFRGHPPDASRPAAATSDTSPPTAATPVAR